MSYTRFPQENSIHSRLLVRELTLRAAIDPGMVLRKNLEEAQELVIQRLFSEYTVTTVDKRTKDVLIEIDCYVFNTEQLRDLLLAAREDGRREAERWMGREQ